MSRLIKIDRSRDVDNFERSFLIMRLLNKKVMKMEECEKRSSRRNVVNRKK
jgi:hypothetical protein